MEISSFGITLARISTCLVYSSNLYNFISYFLFFPTNMAEESHNSDAKGKEIEKKRNSDDEKEDEGDDVLVFIKSQREMNNAMLAMIQKISEKLDTDKENRPPSPKKSRPNTDDVVELHPSDNSLTHTEHEEDEEEEDPWS